MKTVAAVAILFLVIIHLGHGQSRDTTIEKLIDNELIKRKQTKAFKKLLESSEVQSTAAYLYALFQTEFKKLTGQYYSSFTYFSVGYEKLNENEQTNVNKELAVYLAKLRTCGLVTTEQFNEQLEEIEQNKFAHMLQFLPDLAEKIAYKEWIAPHRVLQYGERLLANDVMTQESFDSLKADVGKGKIKSHYQIIDYCKRARFFDLAKYSNDPSVYLEQIHQEVGAILPELGFSNFEYKIEVDSTESFGDYTSHNVIVSLKANGKTYKQKSFISPHDIGKDNNFLGKIDDQEFYQIFNKILMDNQSPLRLHQIQPSFQYSEKPNHQYFGIIILAKHQTDMFHNMDGYIRLSYERFKNKLTTNRIDSAVRSFHEIGLLNHLTLSQIEEAKEKVQQEECRSLNDVLNCFSDVIYHFDTELSNLEDPYTELVKEYARISHNQFNPTNISDDFDLKKKKVTLKFDFKGKQYQRTFDVDSDWIDPDFFSFIHAVATENNLNGQFYDLYSGGQDVSVIYLTTQQYDHIRTHKLLVFSDEWETEEE